MIVKLLAEHHLEFLSLKRGFRGSSESTHVNLKMPHCWKSHALAPYYRHLVQLDTSTWAFIRGNLAYPIST